MTVAVASTTRGGIMGLVVLAAASIGAAGAAAAEPKPQWIWNAALNNQSNAEQTLFLRTVVELGELESASVEITCDNRYALFVNSANAAGGDTWSRLDQHTITRLFKPGKNTLGVKAINDGGPAGLVARFRFKLKDGTEKTVVTDKSWKTAGAAPPSWREPGFDDSAWSAAVELGALDETAPWGKLERVQAAAAPSFERKPRPAGAFQLLDGDRVVFLGDALVERAQMRDDLETVLTSYYPDRNVTFRNLGWSGDNVQGEARAGFGTVSDGFRQLRDQVFAARPTVIFVAYGGGGSLDGASSPDEFRAGLEMLLEQLSATQAEIVLISPIRHERLPGPWPDPEPANALRGALTGAIRDVAEQRGHPFVNLFDALYDETGGRQPLTDNGIHLTDYGYWKAAAVWQAGLGLPPAEWTLNIAVAGNNRSVTNVGTQVAAFEIEGMRWKWKSLDERLPPPPAPASAPSGAVWPGGERVLRVSGLPAGRYALKIDGRLVLTVSDSALARGIALRSGPEFEQAEKLRQKIVEKNQLYFHRWRPQNETYLFGFRKHEQGQNAREIPMFDPLVEKIEREEIPALRKPVPHEYELSRVQ